MTVLVSALTAVESSAAAAPSAHETTLANHERQRAANYPLSRYYLRPLAARLAAALAPTTVRPGHITWLGALCAAAAAVAILAGPVGWPWAAGLVLVYWFCDRTDGLLARRQGTQSAAGAWLDANIDEAADLGLHTAVAWALSTQTGAAWPGWLLTAFLSGKYLLMYGLHFEQSLERENNSTHRPITVRQTDAGSRPSTPRRLYHLPGNADVRIHVLAGALLTGWLAEELAYFALYYHLRWIVRYGLATRRLRRTGR